MSSAIGIAVFLACAGVCLIIAHFALHRFRAYLFYLGIGLIIIGAITLMPSAFLRYSAASLAAGAIFMATREALAETKDRMRRFQEEQKDREQAFGEYLEAMERRRQQLAEDFERGQGR